MAEVKRAFLDSDCHAENKKVIPDELKIKLPIVNVI